ncbi:MAG: hydroxyacylglutathione hydrolase, partial [Rhodospirillaceae bacterium]|nr:hydroxyacylglutathione hydrolase [Rhodospirillaceae bacterium]
ETGATAVVDPSEAEPVLAAAEAQGWTITTILITHHHADHIGGISAIRAATHCQVIAPLADLHRIPDVDLAVSEGDTVSLGATHATVFETPGHTLGHVAYWFMAENALFSGDTLFALGCGRLFEGTPAQMWESLSRLRALPDETLVYCGHEYTLSNARFALTIDPENERLRGRTACVETLAHAKQPTIPSLLGIEKKTNPFLRADDPNLAASLGLKDAPPDVVFAEIRRRKDIF